MRRVLEARLQLERGEDRLDGALRAEEATLRDAAEAPALLRQRLAGGEIDVRDLEQGRPLVTDIHVVACGSDEPEEERRAQNALQRRQRLRKDERLRMRIVRLQRV